MAGRGPLPSGGKKRREHPTAVVLQLHAGGSEPDDIPEMPACPFDDSWSRRAVDVWRAVWAAPKPPEFIADVHRWVVEKLIELEHLSATSESPSERVRLSAEARQLYAHLLVTPGELRRAKVEVRRASPAAAATGTVGRRRRDPRARS